MGLGPRQWEGDWGQAEDCNWWYRTSSGPAKGGLATVLLGDSEDGRAQGIWLHARQIAGPRSPPSLPLTWTSSWASCACFLTGDMTVMPAEGSWAIRPMSDLSDWSSSLRWTETCLTLLKTWCQQQIPWMSHMAVRQRLWSRQGSALLLQESLRSHLWAQRPCLVHHRHQQGQPPGLLGLLLLVDP